MRIFHAGATGMILVGLILGGCAPVETTTQSREERVRGQFVQLAEELAAKEPLASAPLLRYLMAGEQTLTDGTVLSLWVTDPAMGFRSRCYYFDRQLPDGTAVGMGGCAEPTTALSLIDTAGHLVGNVGTWPATRVRLTPMGDDDSQVIVVTAGFFLVPQEIVGGGRPLTITLIGADGGELGTIRDLTPPGSAVPR